LEKQHIRVIARNKKARYNYHIDDEYEAGIVLRGTEVKSIRNGSANLKDSYARVKNGEMFVYQMHIGTYKYANIDNHEPLQPRKLLLHKKEINKIHGKMQGKGYALVPLSLYFKEGKVKISLGLARGKRLYDKRQTIKNREAKRDLDREKKKYNIK